MSEKIDFKKDISNKLGKKLLKLAIITKESAQKLLLDNFLSRGGNNQKRVHTLKDKQGATILDRRDLDELLEYLGMNINDLKDDTFFTGQ